MTDLTLRSVTKSYAGGATVLHPFDLHVKSGELVVLVGPSGCGKSTLLKLIAGLERADGGQIVLGPRDITDLEPRERRIAMVFQNYALYPHLSVRDNLAYPLHRAGTPKAEIAQRVTAVAAQLRLDTLLDRRPSQLSGGQKQRVAMGRAIIRKPDLFLLDEPLSNLDAALRGHVRGEIAELQRRLGTTMIYVTHDQVEAQTLADRVVILRDGVVQQVGTPREIYDRPANIFAASFLGAALPNFLRARIDNTASSMLLGDQAVDLSRLPREVRAAIAGNVEIFVGIRPENFTVDNPSDGAIRFSGKFIRREQVGPTQTIYLRPGFANDATNLVSKLSGRQSGDELVCITNDAGPLEAETFSCSLGDLMFFCLNGEALHAEEL